MKPSILPVCAWALVLMFALGCKGAPPPHLPPAKDMKPVTSAVNGFGFDLWKKVSTKTSGNVIIAPASVWTALAMTELGARDHTDEELRKVLRLSGPMHGAWGKVQAVWNAPSDDVELQVTNRLFGEETYRFEQAYLDSMTRNYGAPLQRVDFKNDAPGATDTINEWGKDATHGRIPQLIPAGALTSDTRLVLTNAVYFLGEWKTPFEKDMTLAQPFFPTPAKRTYVQTMHLTEHFQYAEVDDVQVLEMPYKGGAFAMTFILPKAQDGLDAVSARLDDVTFARWVSALHSTEVAVALPKVDFRAGKSMALRPVLEDMGIATAFDRKRADFTGMANPTNPDDRLFVEQVFHQATLRMDESGTEATAFTAIDMAPEGTAVHEMPQFHADHPYLVVLRDVRTGVVMFVGRVSQP